MKNVLSWGALFLPAAGWITKGPWKINGGWARYWAVTGGADYSGNKRGYNIDFQGAKVYLEGLMARYTGLSIRLASRLGLLCCDDGIVWSSVPARCGYGVLDYFRIYPDACVCCCTLRTCEVWFSYRVRARLAEAHSFSVSFRIVWLFG